MSFRAKRRISGTSLYVLEILPPFGRLNDKYVQLLREAYRTCLTDNGNLHLTRLGHFILNLLSDFS